MELSSEQVFYIIIGALIVITAGIVLSRKMKAKLTKDGLTINTEKGESKDRVKVSKVEASKVAVKNKDNQHVDIKDISNDSDIQVS
jgi:hypothetical protein